MSETATHPAPHRHRANIWALWFGLVGAPCFWFAQLVLGYGLWAQSCYGGDRPAAVPVLGPRTAIFAFDALAIVVSLVAAGIAYGLWRETKAEMDGDPHAVLHVNEGRTRFMAMWGMLSSGCFLAAILFATIMSIWAPPCG